MSCTLLGSGGDGSERFGITSPAVPGLVWRMAALAVCLAGIAGRVGAGPIAPAPARVAVRHAALCARWEQPAAERSAGAAKFAVVIGVNDYGANAPKLRYAVSDATRLYTTLTDPKIGGIPPDRPASWCATALTIW